MGIDIKWENPPGTELTTLVFDPGQPIHLSVHVTDMLGGPAQVTVDVDIRGYSGQSFTPIHLSGATNWFTGNVDWDFYMPSVVAKAKVTVDDHIITVTQNIGIGIMPDPPPSKPNWLLIGGIALVGAVGIGLAVRYLVNRPPKAPKPPQLK